MARVQDGSNGLLDSGATHALRPKRPGENLDRYRQVQVSLAAGGRLTLRMTEGQVLVHVDEGVEPTVPVGRLVKDHWLQLGMGRRPLSATPSIERPHRCGVGGRHWP